MAIGNVNDAPLEMNSLAIKDMRLTTPDLQARIMYHYKQEVLRQLYRIIGSADFIGNPVGLFTNVSSGVADIFYEPFNGVVVHGNRELGIGIAKVSVSVASALCDLTTLQGAASFVKKTVFGFSDSLTKFTSSVGKGLSAATLDEEYQNRRRMTQRRNKPRHAMYVPLLPSRQTATKLRKIWGGFWSRGFRHERCKWFRGCYRASLFPFASTEVLSDRVDETYRRGRNGRRRRILQRCWERIGWVRDHLTAPRL